MMRGLRPWRDARRCGARQVLAVFMACCSLHEIGGGVVQAGGQGAWRCGWEAAEDSVSEIVAEVFSDPVSSSSHILGYGPAEVSGALQVWHVATCVRASAHSASHHRINIWPTRCLFVCVLFSKSIRLRAGCTLNFVDACTCVVCVLCVFAVMCVCTRST